MLVKRLKDPSFILFLSWDFKLIIRKDEFRMTPFFGVSYEEGRNGGLSKGNTKSIFLKANRRFCLPLYDPREYVIPNPFSHHCLELLKDIK